MLHIKDFIYKYTLKIVAETQVNIDNSGDPIKETSTIGECKLIKGMTVDKHIKLTKMHT